MKNREPLPNRREILAAKVKCGSSHSRASRFLGPRKHDGSRPNATLVAGRALGCKGRWDLLLERPDASRWPNGGGGQGMAAQPKSFQFETRRRRGGDDFACRKCLCGRRLRKVILTEAQTRPGEIRNPKFEIRNPGRRVRQTAWWGVADSLLVTSHSGGSSSGKETSESATFERIKTRIS